MFAAVMHFLILLAVAAICVRADPDPNNPGPGDIFIQGRTCMVGWNVDPTGIWKTMHIDFMTGNNFDMIVLAAVGTVDGTNPNQNTFSFTCPQVSPYSAIYFYQFSSPGTSNKTWTGRFTITDSANDVVAPSMSTQPDGSKIPWGIGSLVASSGASNGSTPTNSPAASSTASNVTGSFSSSTSPSTTSTPTAVVVVTSAISATPSTVSTTGTNGAAMFSVSNVVFQTGLALGLAAVGFTVMF